MHEIQRYKKFNATKVLPPSHRRKNDKLPTTSMISSKRQGLGKLFFTSEGWIGGLHQPKFFFPSVENLWFSDISGRVEINLLIFRWYSEVKFGEDPLHLSGDLLQTLNMLLILNVPIPDKVKKLS